MKISKTNTATVETGDTSEVCTALDEKKDRSRRRVRAASALTGIRVRNSADEELGHIEQLMIDIPSGRVVYAVLSFGDCSASGMRWSRCRGMQCGSTKKRSVSHSSSISSGRPSKTRRDLIKTGGRIWPTPLSRMLSAGILSGNTPIS